MSDPEEQDLPFQRSSIASIGARRRWRLFGRAEDDGAADPGPDDDGPPVRSMLGSLAARGGGDPGQTEPASKSMLSLGAGDGVPLLAGKEPEKGGGPAAPLIAHSTIAELAGLEEHETGSFPIERGVLISIAFHVLLLVFLLSIPQVRPGSKQDFFANLAPEPRDDTPIPVIFQDAPGPARTNPDRSPVSDADRRAGGGDRSRPKADTPFVPPSSGVAGLAPGPKAPRIPGSDVPASRAAAEAERRAQAQESETDQQPSDFPSVAHPDTSGPREVSKLAGLDRAIAEAARGTVGGEGGAPASNPDGGYLDSGPLSFDTSWYDWGAYAAEMIRRIKLHWDVPELARLGWKGSLTIRFYIMADGTVADAKILRVSGIPPFDNAAYQAILKSSPFRPLPADLHEDREGVTITFFYNMRPEQDEARARQ